MHTDSSWQLERSSLSASVLSTFAVDALETNDIKAQSYISFKREIANINFTFSWIFLHFHGFFFFPSWICLGEKKKRAPFLIPEGL